jgi:hypothetical protein
MNIDIELTCAREILACKQLFVLTLRYFDRNGGGGLTSSVVQT